MAKASMWPQGTLPSGHVVGSAGDLVDSIVGVHEQGGLAVLFEQLAPRPHAAVDGDGGRETGTAGHLANALAAQSIAKRRR